MADEGRFRKETLVKEGGQGVVWRAHDTHTGQPVALKLPRGAEPEEQALFFQEASLLAGLRHPALVGYVAHGLDPELGPFLALEWIEGEPLSRRLAPLSVEEATSLGLRLADALGALHEAGVIHGDLKPDNVMVPGLASAKLIDLGLARSHSAASAGLAGGTEGYAAPEVLLRRAPTPASDLFSLGVLLWEALAGVPPFPGGSAGRAVLLGSPLDPAPLLARAPDISPRLVELLAELLRRDPEARPAAHQARDRLLALGERPRTRPPRPGSGKLWGRPRELAWLDASSRQQDRVVLVSGPAGVGKTQLAQAWKRGLPAEGRTLWEAHAQPEAGPFAVLRGLLLSALHLENGRIAPTHEELAAFVLPRIPGAEGAMILALLADLWSIEVEKDTIDPLARLARGDPGLRSLLLEQAWLALVRSEKTRSPLVLLVDDVHWADLPSLRLIEAAVAVVGVAVVGMTRPWSEAAGPPPFARCRVETLELGPLGPAEAEILLRSIRPELSAEAVERLVEQGAGMPLFLVELASWSEGKPENSRPLRALLEERIAERPPLERAVLRALALLGYQAPVEGLLALLGDTASRGVVELALERLEASWLVQRGAGGTATFRHETIREATLAQASSAELEELHGKALGWLQGRGEQDALLGWHAEQAGLQEQAAGHYAAASWRALGLDFLSALRFAERALASAPGGAAAVRAMASQAMALGWLGRWEEARGVAAEACQEARPGSAPWVASAATLGFACFSAARFAEMRQVLEQLCDTEPEPDALTLQIWALGINAYSLCYGPCSRELGERFLWRLRALMSPTAPPTVRACELRIQAVVAQVFEGRLDEGIRLGRRSVEEFTAGGDPNSALQGRVLLGFLCIAAGAYQEAADEFFQTADIAERHGMRGVLGFAHLGSAEALLGLGRLDEALARALALPETPGIAGRRFVGGWALRVLAAAHLAQGDAEETLRCVDYALTAIEAPCRELVAALVIRADAARLAGDRGLALASAREAVKIIETPDPFVPDEVGARACLAALLLENGEPEEARKLQEIARGELLRQANRLAEPARARFLARPQARRTLEG